MSRYFFAARLVQSRAKKGTRSKSVVAASKSPPDAISAPLVVVSSTYAAELAPAQQSVDRRPLIEHFYESLGEETRKGYAFDIKKFGQWLGCDDRDAVAMLVAGGPGKANELLLKWMAYLRSSGLQPATRNRRLSAVKSVLRFARLVGVIAWSIDVRGDKVNKWRDTSGPGLAAASQIVQACDEDELSGIRDRVMLLLALRGLRRREIQRLKRTDMDIARSRLRVEGKGERVDWIELPAEIIDAIQKWLVCWDKEHGRPKDEFVFRSLSHHTFRKPITRKGVYHAVVEAGERAGLKVWPHGFRHTGITAALDDTLIRA
jgi:integrase/recombinase XerC